MTILKLKRPLTPARDTSWMWLTARLHNEARRNRMEQRAEIEHSRAVEGFADYVCDSQGRWIPVFGEFAYEPAECFGIRRES